MNIGLDIDGVLADFIGAFISYHNLVYGTDFSYHQFTTLRFGPVIGTSHEEANARVTEFNHSPFFRLILPIQGSQKAVEALSSKARVIVITSRPSALEHETRKWLGRHFPECKEIYFAKNHITSDNQGLKPKEQLCLDNQVKVMIEDDLEHAELCHKAGIKVYLLDQPWNQETIQGAIRAKDWEELSKLLNNQ